MDRQCHKSSSIGLMVSQFSKDYVKKYNEDSDEGYFFSKLVFKMLKNYMNSILIFPFCLKIKIEKSWKAYSQVAQ